MTRFSLCSISLEKMNAMLLSILLPGALLASEPAPHFKWAMTLHSANSGANSGACVVDPQGNAYTTGQTSDAMSFGSISSTGGSTWITKADAEGNPLWVVRDGPNFGTFGWRIGLDANQNVFVCAQIGGYFVSNPFAGTNIACSMAVIKYTKDGLPLGAFAIAQPFTNHQSLNANAASPVDIKILPDGSFYCVSTLTGNVIFGATNLTAQSGSSSETDYAVIKADHAGNVEWVRQITAYGSPSRLGPSALDPDGNLVLPGTFTNTISLGVTNLIVANGYSAFVAKYNVRGDLLRATQIGLTPSSLPVARKAATDLDGNCYISFVFVDQITLGNVTFTNRPGSYNAVAKCDPNGNVLWARQTSEGNEALVALDPLGSVYTAEYSVNSNRTHYAKFDSAGNLSWERLGPAVQLRDISVDSAGAFRILGQVTVTNADFDGLTSTNIWNPYSDAVLAKLNSTIPPHLEIQLTASLLSLSWPALADDYELHPPATLPARIHGLRPRSRSPPSTAKRSQPPISHPPQPSSASTGNSTSPPATPCRRQPSITHQHGKK